MEPVSANGILNYAVVKLRSVHENGKTGEYAALIKVTFHAHGRRYQSIYYLIPTFQLKLKNDALFRRKRYEIYTVI